MSVEYEDFALKETFKWATRNKLELPRRQLLQLTEFQ
jgi:hypothetical protein